MTYVLCLMLIGLVLGLGAVASNPSPFFAALGLVVVAGVGCGVLYQHGGSFLSLILFLIYLGGMLVVFAYSAALASDPHPEGWNSWPVMGFMLGYGVVIGAGAAYFWGEWFNGSSMTVDEVEGMVLFRGDIGGVAEVYSSGGLLLVLGVWALLVALLVVLELTRGQTRGALRAIDK